MKSVSEMIRFLNRCFSTDKRNRRSGVRSASRVAGPEVMEARLLIRFKTTKADAEILINGRRRPA